MENVCTVSQIRLGEGGGGGGYHWAIGGGGGVGEPRTGIIYANTYLSSILGELKVNLWDHVGIIVPQKG